MAVLAGGLAAGATAALPAAANATTCSGGTTVPGTGITSCTATGTVGLLSGGLTINGPAAESWSTTLNGQTQLLFDTTPADEGLVASDLRGLLSTGAGSGWDITASGTAFTGTATGTTIPDNSTGEVLAFNGGGTPATDSGVPAAACYYGTLLCGLPAVTNPSTFPMFVPTGATVVPLRIYNATAGTGTGVIQIGASGAANPGVWSVTLPPSLAVDTYKSTITLTIAAGP
jgi:hypothetical protein